MSLRSQIPSREDGVVRLYRPSHRTFHLVLVAPECVVPGLPRVDPRRIESAGLVVRRLRAGSVQAWRVGADGRTGWADLPAAERDVDPETAPGGSESITKLFAAPPDTCRAAGATIYYALLPLDGSKTSS